MTIDIHAFVERVKHATPEQMTQEFERMLEAQRQRQGRARARAKARWDDALTLMTDKQSAVIAPLLADRYQITKLFPARERDRVAVMLVGPQKWVTARQRLCRELCMVYPDGGVTRTWERTISLATF